MPDQMTAIARGVDAFIRNVKDMCLKIEFDDASQKSINDLWSDWHTIMRWSDKIGKPHNYSRGVLAAQKFRKCLDKYGLDD